VAKTILVTGGARSGKSRYALALAESLSSRRTYVATCPLMDDDEMRDRIARHRRDRASRDWRTIEEPTDLADALHKISGPGVVLVDCLTLWVNNLMYQTRENGAELDEDKMAARCREVLDVCQEREGAVIFVTNEVGMGIVPDNEPARQYRDLVGRSNQVMAAGADVVTLVTCGIPLQLK